MSVKYRYEKDHLQSIADQLSDAIACFFAGSSTDTVMNLTNGCKDKTHNLGTFYKKRGKIERIKFWSARELANGQDSYSVSYARPTSNWTKHADGETDTTRPIGINHIMPQILGTIVDFHQLKEKLLENGLAKVTESKHFYKRWPGFSIDSALNAIDPMDHLRREFAIRAFNRPPKVDAASGIFLDWYSASSVRSECPIERLLSNPPCSLPTGQLGPIALGNIRFSRNFNINSTKLWETIMRLQPGEIASDFEIEEYTRQQTLSRAYNGLTASIMSMNTVLKLKKCHLGTRHRQEYYLNQVQGISGKDLTGTIPHNNPNTIHVFGPD